MADWADEHFYLADETSSYAGRWATLPYQRGILGLMACDDVETLDFMKSARVGYTKMLLASTAYDLAHRRRTSITYLPNDHDRDRFSNTHGTYLVRDVEVLSDAMLTPPEKRSKHNVTSRKHFTGCIWYLLGGFSATNFREMTADVVRYDELDGFPMDVGGKDRGEGGPTDLGDTRLETSSYPKSIRGSTPTITGASLIEASFDQADIQLRRHLQCESCEEWFPLTLAQMKWENRDPDTIRHECPHCHHPMTYADYPRHDEGGRWQSDEGVWMDDDCRFHGPDGHAVETPTHVGVHIWSAYSYFLTWRKLIEQFWKANDAVKKGDTRALKAFTNTRLGETYEDEGETRDGNILKRNREPYGDVDIPNGVKRLTAFVDIQADRAEIEFCGWGGDYESWGILYQVLYGRLDRPQFWDNLDAALCRTFTGPDDTEWQAELVGVDSGYHADDVYTFTKRRAKYWPTKGHKDHGKPIITIPKRPNRQGVKLAMIGTDTAKEKVYERYEESQPGPSYCHYPAEPERGYDSDYFDGATIETKRKKYLRGQMHYVWENPPHGRNEPLDCRVGNLAMLRLGELYKGWRLKEQVARPRVEKPKDEKPGIEQFRKRRGFQRRKKGWVDGWRK